MFAVVTVRPAPPLNEYIKTVVMSYCPSPLGRSALAALLGSGAAGGNRRKELRYERVQGVDRGLNDKLWILFAARIDHSEMRSRGERVGSSLDDLRQSANDRQECDPDHCLKQVVNVRIARNGRERLMPEDGLDQLVELRKLHLSASVFARPDHGRFDSRRD